jgi:chromosome partitioning protein
MTVVVAFLNFKGGVGKTSNVVNIGACLSATHQKRLLLIDLDAQCNTSLRLLGKTALRRHTEEPIRTVTQAFQDKIRGTRLFRFADALVRGVPISERGYKLIPTLDVLPATVDLLEVEEHLGHNVPLGGYRLLFEQTERHLREYDYVLVSRVLRQLGGARK